jgi:hypothetical protein
MLTVFRGLHGVQGSTMSSPYIEEYIQQPATCKLHGYRNQEKNC